MSVAVLVTWLFVFYNIERVSTTIDITDVAYTFVPAIAVALVVVPGLYKAPVWLLTVLPVLLFLALKAYFKQRLFGADLLLTSTESIAIILTVLVARRLSSGVNEFEDTVAHLTLGYAGQKLGSFSEVRASMYRELKRARRHERPLALVAMRVDGRSIQVAVDRMVQQAQQSIMEQYVLSNVAKVLGNRLEDYNIIALQNDDFFVLVPEATPDQLGDFTNWLGKTLSEQVGVTVQIGAASFPQDATTFDGLVEKAVAKINSQRASSGA